VEATPERLSFGASVTLTAPLTQLFDVPPSPVVGAVLSRLTLGLLLPVVVLPALSLTLGVEQLLTLADDGAVGQARATADGCKTRGGVRLHPHDLSA
jgi:hypothetical protein